MNYRIYTLILAFLLTMPAMAQTKKLQLRVIETSDVHGCYVPYDFINRKEALGSLARVATYVDSLRQVYGDRLLLLDNGDILQGQPISYYYNYIDTTSTHVTAALYNYMKYDAATIGNHDVETGHAVYDRWIRETLCPMLGANIIDTRKGSTYLKPYTIIERDGIKVAILGLLTPAIPNWLSEDLWSGLHFEDMTMSARKWMKKIKEEEKADVVIGLFHSGAQGGITTPDYEENASMRIAREVPGFDLILFGHDHRVACEEVVNTDGNTVTCLNPANNALNVADAEITITYDESVVNGEKVQVMHDKQVEGKIVDVRYRQVSEPLMTAFLSQVNAVKSYVDKQIGIFEHAVYSRDCFFGSAAFTDFIHNLQLRITGADVSLNAPLLFDAVLPEGSIHVSDMFNLYKYENELYVMRLTGEEIRKHLEMSYELWANTMQDENDHLLLLTNRSWNGEDRYSFQNPSYNFDSAAGIDYVVDVTKPNGEKVKILRMSNGEPFDETKWYRVAVNSYRGNGGGELLTKGAGIPKDSLESRIIWRSQRDQRYFLTQEIEKLGTVDPQPNNNWKFVPEQWTEKAAIRDRELLFGIGK